MKKIYTLSFLFSVLVFISYQCKHDSDEIPTPNNNVSNNNTNNNTSSLNIKDSVCYSDEIQPILTTYCAYSNCHDAATSKDGINLSSFFETSKVNGANLLTVLDATGKKKMPPVQSTQLPAIEKELLKKWINQGMKDNVDCPESCALNNVSFSQTILPIIQNNCNGCHSGTSPLLGTYNQIKVVADNGLLICSIDHAVGCKAMPPSGTKLDDCKIKQIKKWIENGSPNN